MLKLTKFTGEEFFINPEMIKSIEPGGDTIVTLNTGDRFLVRESSKEIKELFIAYKKEIYGLSPIV